MVSIYSVRENIQSSAWLDKKDNARFCIPIALSKPIGENLNNVTLGRVVYLAAFCEADGTITWFNNMPCDRKKLLWLLGVEDGSPGKKALNRLTTSKAIEKIKAEYYVNFNYFSREEQLFPVLACKHNIKCCDAKKKHEDLGSVARLLPWMNIEWNVLCENPEERDVAKIAPLEISEICRLAKVKNPTGLTERFETIDGIVTLISRRLLPDGREAYQVDTRMFFSPYTNSWAKDFDATLIKEDRYENLA